MSELIELSSRALSTLGGCLALRSSVKPGPAANFLVRMDLNFYIAGVSHLPIHSQHECYSFRDNSVNEFSLVTSFL